MINSRAEATRSRIIESAAELMAIQGYQSTGLDSILHRSGVSKGNFYHHFPSKNDLGLEVLRHIGQKVYGYLSASMLATDDPLEQLDLMFDALVEFQERQDCRGGCPLGNLAAEMSDHHEGFRRQLGEIFQRWQALVARPLREAARLHGRQDLDTEGLARYVICAIEGAVLMAKVSRDVCEVGDSVEHLKRYIRQHFRA